MAGRPFRGFASAAGDPIVLFGSVRLTARPGRFRLFGQLDYQRDRSAQDAFTLEYCGEEEPFPDYVSTTATVGVRMFF